MFKFFDASRRRPGQQPIGNRHKDIFDEIDTPFYLSELNDTLRVRLNEALGRMTKRDIHGRMKDKGHHTDLPLQGPTPAVHLRLHTTGLL